MKRQLKKINTTTLLALLISSACFTQYNNINAMDKTGVKVVGYGLNQLTKQVTLALGFLFASSRMLSGKIVGRMPAVSMPAFIRNLYQSKLQPAGEILQKVDFEKSVESAIGYATEGIQKISNKHKWKVRVGTAYIAWKLSQYLKKKLEDKDKKSKEGKIDNIINIYNIDPQRLKELLDQNRSY